MMSSTASFGEVGSSEMSPNPSGSMLVRTVTELDLIPLKKRVEIICLSKVIGDLDELCERVATSRPYVMEILQNEADILRCWKERRGTRSNCATTELQEITAINEILLEWNRRLAAANYRVTGREIMQKAYALKTLFNVPGYSIGWEVWNKLSEINRFPENQFSEVASFHLEDIMWDLREMLPGKTFQKFISCIARGRRSVEVKNRRRIASVPREEASDGMVGNDVLLVEKPIECIDITEDCDDSEDPTDCLIPTESTVTVLAQSKVALPMDDLDHILVINEAFQSDCSDEFVSGDSRLAGHEESLGKYSNHVDTEIEEHPFSNEVLEERSKNDIYVLTYSGDSADDDNFEDGKIEDESGRTEDPMDVNDFEIMDGDGETVEIYELIETDDEDEDSDLSRDEHQPNAKLGRLEEGDYPITRMENTKETKSESVEEQPTEEENSKYKKQNRTETRNIAKINGNPRYDDIDDYTFDLNSELGNSVRESTEVSGHEEGDITIIEVMSDEEYVAE